MTFKKDDRVKVVKRGIWSTGRSGTVVAVKNNKVDVLIDSFGYLSYHPSSLALIWMAPTYNNDQKGEDTMLMGNYRIAKIKFIEGTNTDREYDYALYDESIERDDCVVVKSAHHGFGIAQVTEIIPDDQVTETMRDYCNEGREIVAAFDMYVYTERVEKRKKAKQLKAEMNKKMKEMKELALIEMMAEQNPELKAMLDEYKELVK